MEEKEYKYEILCRYVGAPWEHCDYAKDEKDRDYLLAEYRKAYGAGFQFKIKKVKK